MVETTANKSDMKKLLNRALWLKVKSNRTRNNDLTEIKARIDASSQRMTNIKAGRSIAPSLENRDWKSAADWAFAHASHNEDTLADELYALLEIITVYETKKQLVSNGHKLMKVSVPIIGHYVEVSAEMSPRAEARSPRSKKGSNGEGLMKQDKVKVRIPLSQKLDKLRADRTEYFINEVTTRGVGVKLNRAQLVVPVSSFSSKNGGNGTYAYVHGAARRIESRPGSSSSKYVVANGGGRRSRPETAEGDLSTTMSASVSLTPAPPTTGGTVSSSVRVTGTGAGAALSSSSSRNTYTVGFCAASAAPPSVESLTQTQALQPPGRSKSLAFKRKNSLSMAVATTTTTTTRGHGHGQEQGHTLASDVGVGATTGLNHIHEPVHSAPESNHLEDEDENEDLSEPSLRAEKRRQGLVGVGKAGEQGSTATTGGAGTVMSPREGPDSVGMGTGDATAAAIVSAATTHKTKPAGPIQYSNMKTNISSGSDNGSGSGFGDISGNDSTAISEETRKCLERYKAIFDEASNNMTQLEHGYEAKLAQVQDSGDDLLEQWEHFGIAKSFQQEYLLYIFDHKEFLFPDEMMFNLQSLECDSNNLQMDLKHMKRRARSKLQLKGIQNILKYRFVISGIARLQEYFKKTKQIIPLCCFRFLSVLKNILMLGFEFTSEMYYYVMERSVKNPKDEHAALLIYETFKSARDYLGIPPEDFLVYLKENKYQECPKLLELVRTNKEKKLREQFMERTKGLNINTGGGMGDNSVVIGPKTGPAAFGGGTRSLKGFLAGSSTPNSTRHMTGIGSGKPATGPPTLGAFSKASSARDMDTNTDTNNTVADMDSVNIEEEGVHVHVQARGVMV